MAALDDEVLLATVVTALLIRLGGRTVITYEEWLRAVEADNTLWMHREGEDRPIEVVLLPKKGALA